MPLQVLRTNYSGRGKYRVIAAGLNTIGRVLNNLKGLEPIDITAAGEEIRIGLGDTSLGKSDDDGSGAGGCRIIDQFRVFRVLANTKYFVDGGTYLGLNPIYNPALMLPQIQWYPEEDDDLGPDGDEDDVSLPVAIAADTSQRVWCIEIGATSVEAILLVHFDATMDVAAVSAAVTVGLAESGFEPLYGIIQVALVERPTAGPIVVTQYMDNFPVTAPETLDHISMRGGVWQDVRESKTTVIKPVSGDVIWGGDSNTSTDNTISEPLDCAAAPYCEIWAKLDLSSVDPELKFMRLFPDPGAPGDPIVPPFADDEKWQKIATVTREGDPAEDPTTVKVEVAQHHAGGIDLNGGKHGVLDAYAVDIALGSSSAIPPTTADWFAVPFATGTVRRIDAAQFEWSAGGYYNDVHFLKPDRFYLVILTGQFSISASGSTGAGGPKFSVQAVAICRGSGAASKGVLIHPLTLRKDAFLQHPTFASGDDPPLTIPACLEHYASFAIATIICPRTDLTLPGDPEAEPPTEDIENTLSVWARGRGTISAELVILELHNLVGDPPT